MEFAFLELLGTLGVVVIAIVFAALGATMTVLPYISGLVVALLLTYIFPGLREIVPGEHGLSIFMVVLFVEFLVAGGVYYHKTSKAMILCSSMFFIGLAMVLVGGSLKYASWQKAAAVTIIYIIAAGIVLGSNLTNLGTDCFDERGWVSSFLVGILHALTVGINLFVVFGCIWEKYVEKNVAASAFKTFDFIVTAGAIIAMAVTVVLSMLRDRRSRLVDQVIE